MKITVKKFHTYYVMLSNETLTCKQGLLLHHNTTLIMCTTSENNTSSYIYFFNIAEEINFIKPQQFNEAFKNYKSLNLSYTIYLKFVKQALLHNNT